MMTEILPPRPFGQRIVNGVGGVLRGAGLPLVELDTEVLLDRACRLTGLADWGDPFFREPLRVLLEALDKEAALTLFGRVLARTEVVRLLENRLRLADVLTYHPDVAEGEISRPIVIVGLPESGMELLHELLAFDPAHRVPRTWEVMYPWPPPAPEAGGRDARVGLAARHLAALERLAPHGGPSVRDAARRPADCAGLLAYEFVSPRFLAAYSVPSYRAWLDHADVRWAYAEHRRQLQYLQWRCPGERWVLRSPAHLWALDAVLAVYPDARVMHVHRDPVPVIEMLAHRVALRRARSSNRVDQAAIGAECAAYVAEALRRAEAARDELPAGTAPVADVYFADLVGDAMAVIRRLYAHFDLALPSLEVEYRMRGHLVARSLDRPRAALRDAGLDPAASRTRFRDYQERFTVASE